MEFIEAVDPTWAVFPTGHAYRHPRSVTAKRFLDLGYPKECLLRTDLGDDEGAGGWSYGSKPQYQDGIGDDGIEIVLSQGGVKSC